MRYTKNQCVTVKSGRYQGKTVLLEKRIPGGIRQWVITLLDGSFNSGIVAETDFN